MLTGRCSGGDIGHVDAVDSDLATVRRFETADQPQGGGLAATARAEQREELAAVDGEVDALQHGRPVVRFRQVDKLDLSTRPIDHLLVRTHRYFLSAFA